MVALQERLKHVRVGEPVAAGPLQVFGLRWDSERPVGYRTLDEALAGGELEVTEVSEGGSVPTLRVINKGAGRVLMIAGEQLVGAKQNRVLNVTILVEANSKLDVPVSCVEAGRWGYLSRKFRSAGSSSHAYLRAMMSKQAHGSYRISGKPSSDQSAVWREVDRKLGAMGSASPSRELEAVYQDHRARLDKVIAEAKLPEDCCGVVFAFGGRVAGLDLFDKPATLTRLMPKLVQAYAVDALEQPGDQAPVSRADVENWLHAASGARFERFDSPGLGDDVRIEGRSAVGAGLVVEEQPVHVELFPENEGDSQAARPSEERTSAQASRSEPPPPVRPAPQPDQTSSPPTGEQRPASARRRWWDRLRRRRGE